MQTIQDAILSGATIIITALIGALVSEAKKYISSKISKNDLAIMEQVAGAVVKAVEQKAQQEDEGISKYRKAVDAVQAVLDQQGISYTDEQIDSFIESAVKSMKDSWTE